MSPEDLKALVRTVPDFPARGIQFRDITTLIAHGQGLAATMDHLVAYASKADVAAIAGIEARGFIFGAAIAARMGLGFIPLRKAGKLPVPSIGIDYDLEYGKARIELDPGAVDEGGRVLLVDDLLATGGTAKAGAALLRQAGAVVDHALFVIDLPELGGGNLLRENGIEVSALMQFAGH
ncbi:adenine phosphoribosyltransferase [Altererythrobacter atlanticus]|uniref:Adenine phosphoribosyltransferase n=1 Tax=Croceibacterium atlanticum TaxID=1267766 RepID=A0A0F7KXC0_9SPHN|nr:adenine phosphoribosyltransferase [Croceibacterium atlanticum]AKH43425.1 Adenine phosphoribosyltransferase [Croceibacterium atlanticum]MBB5731867.1 adenine phosphoribosyltransferase [Croceibacterium atlanticum]